MYNKSGKVEIMMEEFGIKMDFNPLSTTGLLTPHMIG